MSELRWRPPVEPGEILLDVAVETGGRSPFAVVLESLHHLLCQKILGQQRRVFRKENEHHAEQQLHDRVVDVLLRQTLELGLDFAVELQPGLDQLVVQAVADLLLPLLVLPPQFVQAADAVAVGHEGAAAERGAETQERLAVLQQVLQQVALAGAQRALAALQLRLVKPPFRSVGHDEPAKTGKGRVLERLPHRGAARTSPFRQAAFPSSWLPRGRCCRG